MNPNFPSQLPLSLPENDSFLQIDLEAFPLIEDFSVVPVDLFSEKPRDRKGFFFHRAEFCSDEYGTLAYYDFGRALQHLGHEGVPCGTLEKPWFQFELAWQIEIAEGNSFVYVCQGDNNKSSTEYTIWFRVPSQDYWNAWSDWLAEVESLQ